MGVSLAETMKRNMTKAITIETHPQAISQTVLDFVEKNVKSNRGNSTLKFVLTEPKNKVRISLVTSGTGFELNEEMIQFLEKSPELEVQVQTV